jgi:hypothetical protein
MPSDGRQPGRWWRPNVRTVALFVETSHVPRIMRRVCASHDSRQSLSAATEPSRDRASRRCPPGACDTVLPANHLACAASDRASRCLCPSRLQKVFDPETDRGPGYAPCQQECGQVSLGDVGPARQACIAPSNPPLKATHVCTLDGHFCVMPQLPAMCGLRQQREHPLASIRTEPNSHRPRKQCRSGEHQRAPLVRSLPGHPSVNPVTPALTSVMEPEDSYPLVRGSCRPVKGCGSVGRDRSGVELVQVGTSDAVEADLDLELSGAGLVFGHLDHSIFPGPW